MYTVEKIEKNIVTLEERRTKKIFDIEKERLPRDIKEGDILDIKNEEYIINKELTNKLKKQIRNKFNSLLK